MRKWINLCANGSFTASVISDWHTDNSIGSISAAGSISLGTGGTFGNYLQVVTNASAVNGGAYYQVPGTFRAGETYTFAVKFFLPTASAGVTLRAGVNGLNNSTDLVSVASASIPRDTWTTLSIVWTPTAERSVANLFVRQDQSLVSTWYIDEAQFVIGAVLPAAGDVEFPNVMTSIAFASAPSAASPTWTDVSAFVTNVSTRRGRRTFLDRYDAGTATIVLDNTDSRFDPTYAAGPYYPNVLPVRRIRVQASIASVTYSVFAGYIDAWPPSWDTGGQAEYVNISATDAFKILQGATYVGDRPAELTGNRIGSIAVSGVPIDLSMGSIGSSTLSAIASVPAGAGVNLTSGTLDYLNQIAETENGELYMDAGGTLRFRDRHYRMLNKGAVAATFGDDPTSGLEIVYDALSPSYDDLTLYNSITATDSHAGTANTTTATDAASQTAYLPRPYSRSLLIDNAQETTDCANWLLQRLKDVDLRFDSITFGPGFGVTPNPWPTALGLDFGDRLRILKRTPGGNTIDKQCYIEAITHEIADFSWTTTYGLSPALTQSYWVLDSATLSVLDSTTRLTY